MAALRSARAPAAAGRRCSRRARPGSAGCCGSELAAIEGVTVTGTGCDGRCDIVFAEADRPGRAEVLRLRLADEVFAEIGRASRAGGAGPVAVAASAVEPAGLERALSVRAQEIRPLAGSMTFRVSARVLPDSPFGPADLRRAAAAGSPRPGPAGGQAASLNSTSGSASGTTGSTRRASASRDAGRAAGSRVTVSWPAASPQRWSGWPERPGAAGRDPARPVLRQRGHPGRGAGRGLAR